jgi:hypothetical protein
MKLTAEFWLIIIYEYPPRCWKLELEMGIDDDGQPNKERKSKNEHRQK